jgi:cell wall-associated NlpC family hydrolase
VALALVVSGCLAVHGGASAAPRPSVEQVRRQVETLRAQAEAATERYNATQETMASLGVRLAAARSKLAEQHKAVEIARGALGMVAADTYKAGDLASLSLFLGDHPDQYLAGNDILVSLGDRKAQAVSDLFRQRQLLVATMTDVQSQQERLEITRRQLKDAQRDVQGKLAAAAALLARLTGEQRGVLTRALGSSYRTGLADLGITIPKSGNPRCSDVPMGPIDPRVSRVISYLCNQLGDPYHWAGTGPSGFDCSGLTMMAWRQVGVSLPHNAEMQAGFGRQVGLADLKPGDLVFFHHPIAHVGIYLGDGVMIHAPQTGDVVKVAPMRYSGDFAGAVRL